MKKIYLLISLCAVIMSSCITDTVDDFSQFTIQLPIFFTSEYPNRAAPDSSVDFSNLFEYPEYKNNREKIEKSEIYQFNYRIDSLVLQNNQIYNPEIDNLVFDYIKFKIVFAKPKYSEYSTNPNDFTIDKSKGEYILGEFVDVDVKNFFKQSKNIKGVDDSVSATISDILKENPYFFIITEYSKVKGSTVPKDIFPFIRSKFDLVVRLKFKL